jgi:glycosyltransferase involved in cell wall biosynthesis
MLSIVIPVRNEAAYIEGCLESVLDQDFSGHDYEVIVIDGMSDDGTTDKIQKLKAKYPNLKLLENPKKTVSSGVNVGIRNSAGEIVIRMDAHALYAPDYVKACLEVMEATGADNVGGPAAPLPGAETDVARAIALAHLSPFGLGGGAFRRSGYQGYVETVWPGCFRRAALERVGLLDERLTRTEDLELNTRIAENGGRIYLSPKIKASYLCRPTLRELWRQRWWDGIGVVQTLAVNPRAPKPRHFVPLAFVFSLLLLSGLSMPGIIFLRLLTVEILCYLAAMAGATLSFGIQGGRANPTWGAKPVWLLPLVFAVLHFSYGLGSLWAVVTAPAWWGHFRRPAGFAPTN